MTRRLIPALFAVWLLFATGASAAQSAPGIIVSREPFSCPSGSYEDWLGNFEGDVAEQFARLVDKAFFDRVCAGETVAMERISYLSGGLEVNGYAVYPRAADGPSPIIIYNHGGVLEWGNIYFFDLLEFARLAEDGYVVLASHFRGEGGSEGQADMGRGDVADAVNLIEAAREIEGADPERVGMWGFSRGGRVTYQALAASDRVDAAVVIGGPVDALTFFRHAEFDEHVYPRAIPDYATDSEAALERNSPLRWAQRLSPSTPLLILHGGADERVETRDSLQMADRLQALGRRYRLKIYEGGSHSLFFQWEDVRAEMDRWWGTYLRAPASADE